MEPLIAAVKPHLPEVETYFFRPDKFYFELNVWETDFEDRLETYIKISDLRFAIEHGFDLTKHVMEYVVNMPKEPGYLEPILAAFRRYIKFLRTGIGLSDGTFNISNPLMNLGVEETVELFCKEAMVCLPLESVPHWNYRALLVARDAHIISDDEYYNICTSPTDYYLEAMERIKIKERALWNEKNEHPFRCKVLSLL
ncbi:MAG: hypothetical protein IJ756_08390 [Paludibacteraceae bacterium]|nr:hypothetical protein [Paludibacteraceae bacterium]